MGTLITLGMYVSDRPAGSATSRESGDVGGSKSDSTGRSIHPTGFPVIFSMCLAVCLSIARRLSDPEYLDAFFHWLIWAGALSIFRDRATCDPTSWMRRLSRSLLISSMLFIPPLLALANLYAFAKRY
jgi:hypothetical protein